MYFTFKFYKLYFADAKEGLAGFFGTMRENARPVTVVLRLKIENRKVTEAEAFISRDPEIARRFERESPDVIFTEIVPETSRSSRQDLSTIATAPQAPLIDEERQLVLVAGKDTAAVVAIRNKQSRKIDAFGNE